MRRSRPRTHTRSRGRQVVKPPRQRSTTPRVPLALKRRQLAGRGRATSILALGTSRLVRAGQREAIRMLREAIDHGVNVIETGWEYGEGCTQALPGARL